MLAAAKAARSRAIYPALMLALNTGERDAEIRGLQWERVDLVKAILTVGDSKTRSRRRPDDSAELRIAGSHGRVLDMVHAALRDDPTGMVRFPVRQTAAEGSDPPDGDTKDVVE